MLVVASRFNLESISLHDISHIRDVQYPFPGESPIVDRNEYLRTISESRWYGPYRQKGTDTFWFVSAKIDGSVNFSVRILLTVTIIYGEIKRNPLITILFIRGNNRNIGRIDVAEMD